MNAPSPRNTIAALCLPLISLSLLSAPALAAGDVDAGKKVFRKCRACHVAESEKNGIGPSLQGVVGRVPGTVEGYKYSKDLAAFGAEGAVWDEATLNKWLTKPKDLVQGTKMSFPGLKDEEDRMNVIAYLKQFSQ